MYIINAVYVKNIYKINQVIEIVIYGTQYVLFKNALTYYSL